MLPVFNGITCKNGTSYIVLLNKMHKPHIPNIAFSTRSHTPFVEELFAKNIHCMMVRASPGERIRVPPDVPIFLLKNKCFRQVVLCFLALSF